MNALIVAAGLGTRLKPLTDTMPKALVPVGGVPMLEHQIGRLREEGFTHIVVNVHHFGEQIIDFVRAHDFGVQVDISDERGLLLDTGGALRQASHFFTDGEPVLIHNVDIFSNASPAELYAQHVSSGADASLLVSRRETARYLAFDEAMRLVGWTNVKTQQRKVVSGTDFGEPDTEATLLAFAGIHVVSPSLFGALDDFGTVFSIIDFYLSAASHYDIRGIEPPAGFRLVDAGKPETLPLAAELLKNSCGQPADDTV
ncbi:MAG: NTP transferase domain-containing protein [Bacteroidaceae bacterium]|nr:NTP transferase domain-containing protein [Bacteroidaceae bacterium]